MSVSIEDMFDYGNNPFAIHIHELEIYFSTPSVENAINLLTRLGIPVPYTALTTSTSKRSRSPSHPPSQPSQSRPRRGGAHGDTFDIFTRVDALHDIYNGQPIHHSIIDKVINRCLPTENYKNIKGYCLGKVHETILTRQLTKELENMFGLNGK